MGYGLCTDSAGWKGQTSSTWATLHCCVKAANYCWADSSQDTGHLWGCRVALQRMSNMPNADLSAVAVGTSVNGHLQLQKTSLTALRLPWILAIRKGSTLKYIHYPHWLFWSFLPEWWKTDKAITFMFLKCKWWWQTHINSTNKVNIPFSALVLHSDSQKSPMGNRENIVQKRKVMLINRCSNICSFFFFSCKSKPHDLTIMSCISFCITGPIVFL